MPAIQAMRSDALALRAKEDVQEKIPSFFNSVNKSLGQNIVQGQDSAQAVAEARFAAANQLAATLRQKLDGEGGLAELVAGAGMDLINSSISLLLAILGKTTTQDLLDTASAISAFLSEREALQLQWDAAAATFAQWTVQAGYTGRGDFFPSTTTAPTSQTTEQTVTQWMKASGGPAVLPLRTDGTPNLSALNFVGDRLDPPPGLTLYQYTDTNLAGGTSLRDITVNFDRSGDGLFGAVNATGIEHKGIISPGTVAQGDASSQLFKDAAGDYWLRYDYITTVTKTATPSTLPVTRVSVSGIGSGVDYYTGTGLINGTLAPNNSDTRDNRNPDAAPFGGVGDPGYDSLRNFQTNVSSSAGTTLNVASSNGFYVGDVIEIPVGSASPQGYDYRTIMSVPTTGSIVLDAPLSAAVTSGQPLHLVSYPDPADFSPAVQTTLSAPVSAPPTSTLSAAYVPSSNNITVASDASFLVGDLMGVTLDSGSVEYRTIISKPGGGVLVLSGPFSGAVSAGANASTTGVSVADASGLAVNDLVGITLASGAVEYRTVTNKIGNRLILEAPLPSAANTGALVSTVSGTDANSYPATPRFYRADNITAGGTLGTIEIAALKPVFEKSALGGRGATTYRDALTPRWTDRNYYVGVDGVTRNYDAYYAWGSVGSISRVGRY